MATLETVTLATFSASLIVEMQKNNMLSPEQAAFIEEYTQKYIDNDASEILNRVMTELLWGGTH